MQGAIAEGCGSVAGVSQSFRSSILVPTSFYLFLLVVVLTPLTYIPVGDAQTDNSGSILNSRRYGSTGNVPNMMPDFS